MNNLRFLILGITLGWALTWYVLKPYREGRLGAATPVATLLTPKPYIQWKNDPNPLDAPEKRVGRK